MTQLVNTWPNIFPAYHSFLSCWDNFQINPSNVVVLRDQTWVMRWQPKLPNLEVHFSTVVLPLAYSLFNDGFSRQPTMFFLEFWVIKFWVFFTITGWLCEESPCQCEKFNSLGKVLEERNSSILATSTNPNFLCNGVYYNLSLGTKQNYQWYIWYTKGVSRRHGGIEEIQRFECYLDR